MKLRSAFISGLAIISSQITHAGESYIVVPVSDLEKIGLLPAVIQEEFYNKHQININWDEHLKVSSEDEGKDIRFETYDHVSTIVPLARACGTCNKINPTR